MTSQKEEFKDVYETEDLPEADQSYDTYDDKNVDILKINPVSAFNRFKGKSLITPNKKPKLNQIENPIARSKKLKSEIAELKEMVEKLDESSKITEKEPVSKEQLLTLIDALSNQLNDLQVEKQLENIDIKLCCKPDIVYKRYLKCMKEIESYSKQEPKKIENIDDPINYEIKYNKPLNDYVRATRLSNLMKRMEKLERVLGNDNLKLANVVSECPSVSGKVSGKSSSKQIAEAGGILEAVERLTAKTSLLHGPILTAIESRISFVETKLKSIHSVSSSGAELDLESQNKIADLYELIKKWDPVVDTVPNMLDNIREMQDLHQLCAKMSQSVYYVNLKNEELNNKFESDKIAIKNMENNLCSNFSTIEENIKRMENRLIKL